MRKNSPPKFLMNVAPYFQDFIRTVNKYHITHFFHDITYGHNKISILTPDSEMLRFYYENNIPIACCNEFGRILADGMYINKTLMNQYNDYPVLFSKLRDAGLKRSICYGENALHYVMREEDCQHMFTFFFDLPEDDFLHLLINQHAIIQDTIDHYNFIAKDILLEAKSSENRITLPNVRDFRYSSPLEGSSFKLDWDHIFQYSFEQWDQILKKPRYWFRLQKGTVIFSRMEIKVSIELLKGKHAGEIANVLNIKQTTVESYLQNIKNKLGATSKSEIVEYIIGARLLHQISL